MHRFGTNFRNEGMKTVEDRLHEKEYRASRRESAQFKKKREDLELRMEEYINSY